MHIARKHGAIGASLLAAAAAAMIALCPDASSCAASFRVSRIQGDSDYVGVTRKCCSTEIISRHLAYRRHMAGLREPNFLKKISG